jgi:predicted esterase
MGQMPPEASTRDTMAASFRISRLAGPFLACVFVLAGIGTSVAQVSGAASVTDPRIVRRTYQFDGTGKSIPYAVFVAPACNEATPCPLIVGLHGQGRSYDSLMGYDGLLDLAVQGRYIVATPLGYNEFGWYGSSGPDLRPGQVPPNIAAQDPPPSNLGELSERDVMNVLERVRREFNVDATRIFLFGHSMGGGGAYHLAAKYPTMWRAVAVAAPAPDASMAQVERMKGLPFLVLQGDADQQVLPAKTRATIDRMKALGVACTYVEIPGGDHSRFIERDRHQLARVFSFFSNLP